MSLYSIKVRFMCKFCGGEFQYIDQFIEHKILKHLIEFQQIKSIVFEESVFQNCPLPPVPTITSPAGAVGQEPVPAPAPSPSPNVSHRSLLKRSRHDYQNQLSNIAVAVSRGNNVHHFRSSRISAKASRPLPRQPHKSTAPAKITKTGTDSKLASNPHLKSKLATASAAATTRDETDKSDPPNPNPLGDVVIKQEPGSGSDECDQGQGEDEPNPSLFLDQSDSTNSSNQAQEKNNDDDLDPSDQDHDPDHDHEIAVPIIKCEVGEFEFETESTDAEDGSNTSNLRLVDDPDQPNFISADSLSQSQSSHYTPVPVPDDVVQWGRSRDDQVNMSLSDLYPSSLLVPLEVSGYHLQNSNPESFPAVVEGVDNRHFRFPFSQPQPVPVSVPGGAEHQIYANSINSKMATAQNPIVGNLNHGYGYGAFYDSSSRNRLGQIEVYGHGHGQGLLSQGRSKKRRSSQIGNSGASGSGSGSGSALNRPYKCQVPNCDSSFSLPYNLNYHMKLKHSEGSHLKNFTCEICQKSFFTKGELNGHAIVHTDEKPFECPFEGCTAAYKRKNKLTKHLKCNHPNYSQPTFEVN